MLDLYGRDKSRPYCAAGMRAASHGRCTLPANIAISEGYCDFGRSMRWESVTLICCGRKCSWLRLSPAVNGVSTSDYRQDRRGIRGPDFGSLNLLHYTSGDFCEMRLTLPAMAKALLPDTRGAIVELLKVLSNFRHPRNTRALTALTERSRESAPSVRAIAVFRCA